MGKLHELLAAIEGLKKTSTEIMQETLNVFKNKEGLFDGMTKIYLPYDEESKDLVEPTIVPVTTTVIDKIKYTAKSVIKAIDSEVTLDETNRVAIADLECDGVKFGTFSATALLDIEKYLLKILAIYSSIPTLDNSKIWEDDKTTGKNIKCTAEEEQYRSIKKDIPIVLYPATDRHAAQVQLIKEPVAVGLYKIINRSGKISSSDKATYLEKIDNLIASVRSARAQANGIDIVKKEVGMKIFQYINS